MCLFPGIKQEHLDIVFSFLMWLTRSLKKTNIFKCYPHKNKTQIRWKQQQKQSENHFNHPFSKNSCFQFQWHRWLIAVGHINWVMPLQSRKPHVIVPYYSENFLIPHSLTGRFVSLEPFNESFAMTQNLNQDCCQLYSIWFWAFYIYANSFTFNHAIQDFVRICFILNLCIFQIEQWDWN